MGHIAECAQYEVQSPRQYVTFTISVVFGSASIASQSSDAIGSAPVVTRSAAGTYTIAGLPVFMSTVGLTGTIVSAASTVAQMLITAQSASAGTAGFKLTPAASATATDPATGDTLTLKFTVRVA